MRKVLLMVLMLAAFCIISAGGCGGSDDNGVKDTGPKDWSFIAGSWQPMNDGKIIYYNTKGEETEICKIDVKVSESVDVNVTGASSLYDLKFSDGVIHFNHSSGANQHTVIESKYSDFSHTSYKRTDDGKLSRSDTDELGTLTKTFQYVDDDHIKAQFTRKEGSTTRMKAEVEFERIAD